MTSENQDREQVDAQVWDDGLQNERTSLAWTRSTLASLGCALLLARLAARTHWGLGVAVAGITLMLGTAAIYLCTRRYKNAAKALDRGTPLPDGTLPAIAASILLVIGLVSAILILSM